MDLNLLPDQELLRSETHKFLEREANTAKLRSLAESDAGFDRAWWKVGTDLGWTSLLVPEELNGGSVSGGPLSDLAIVAEEAGQFAAPGPLAVTNAVITALTETNAEARASEVADIMSGNAIATWAVYEPGKGFAPTKPATTATVRDGGFTINGVKDRVEAGDQADLFLIGAMADGKLSQFIVRADAPGVRVERMWSLDLTRRYAKVTFDNVTIPKEALVGEIGQAAASIERQCQVMFVLQCAETSGTTDRVLGFTLDWANDRIAFGRQLSAYQVIKHRFSNMRTWLEAMHATTEASARAVQARSDDAAKLARAANLFVHTRALDIIQDCVQIHGGIGVTYEHDLHIYLRRATVNRTLFGTPAEQRNSLAALLAAA